MTVEHVNLLPRNATALEKALAIVNDPLVALREEFDSILLDDANPPPALLPFLVWEYGLGELSPYLPNLYDLISDGVLWQRVRGTPAAVYKGLGWLGYSGVIEEDPTRRRYWSGMQLDLDAVRGADVPDLDRIEGVTALSIPLRSRFYRGFEGYDIRAAETGYHRFGDSMIASHSGARLRSPGAKWSFGRKYSHDHTFVRSELEAIGVWIDEVPESDLWVDADYLWAGARFLWNMHGVDARLRAISEELCALRAWVRFDKADGSPIGYCRASLQTVRPATTGEYTIGSTTWRSEKTTPNAVHVLARTPFGAGQGMSAASMSVVFNATLGDGVKPGTHWIEPDKISGGVSVGSSPVSISFGLTVREIVSIVLRVT